MNFISNFHRLVTKYKCIQHEQTRIPIYDQPVAIKNIDSLVFSIPLCFTETSLIANTKYSQKCEHKNIIPQIAQNAIVCALAQ